MSYLNQQIISSSAQTATSYLGMQSGLQSGQSFARKKVLAAGVSLTSLVDCFTILVVYLLVATTFGTEQIEVPQNVQLPKAHWAEDATQGALILYDGNQILSGSRAIKMESLADALIELKQTSQSDVLTLQADKNTDFSKINPIVLMGLQAGFTKIQFAALHEDHKQ